MKREDYLPEDLLPRPANWYGGDPEPDFKECRNDPDKVFVLSSGGYILYDKREEDRGIDMILNSQTRLFIGGELLTQVGVSKIEWRDTRDAHVEVFGPFPEARTALEKVKDGVEIGVVAICAGDHVCRCNGELLVSLKDIRDIERWICHPVVLSPDNLSCLTIRASFKCTLEFTK